MKVFDVESDSTLREKQIVDMTGENSAIATNNIDKIAFGGLDKKVYLQNVELDKDGQLVFNGELQLAMQFDSQVTGLEFVGAKYLLARSEDTSVQLMDLDSGKVKSFQNKSNSCSVRNAAVDSSVELLATTRCDGTLIFTKIENMEQLHSYKIAEKTLNFGP